MKSAADKNNAPNMRSIFCEAMDRTTGPERAAYLDQACGQNPELRARIEALLKAHEQAGGFLNPNAIDPAIEPDHSPLAEGPGTVIGRYKILEKIGEGGMAVVYMAEQERPIRRKVALKIIKLGMDTRQVIARFEAERQALAMMDHPNIAKVHDAGATDTGRPYFVMELVTGVAITEYCDKNNLGTKDRLELFVQVCDAVQHAHEKGIVHRDIKPSNVMIAHHAGNPVPKVIDFGIAKATNQRLTEKTLFTRYAHIIGTPAYMSPEQAELSDLGIDIRSDIYSLGVLLYELLTGTTPFSEEELRKAGYLEMQRIIREQEPARPSTKLSTLGETLTDVAKRRGCTPDLLTRAIRGDLDWIVMKALEKDRARRYEGAYGLALDIQRHLEHRPVAAHAPSGAYRLRKFLRRNRLQIGIGLAVVLVIGTIVLSSIWSQHQVQLAEAEGVRQMNVLAEARKLIAEGDLPAACKTLRPILESRHVGIGARTLFANTFVHGQMPDETVEGTEALMDRHYLEKVKYYTKQIAANPRDPNNYLRRAQQYCFLCQERNLQADMIRYASILGQGQVPMLLFGSAKRLRPMIATTSRNRFVLSLRSREDGNTVMSVAFGQKERSAMKRFDIPILLASMFGACVFSGLDTPVVLADFTFETPVGLNSVINTPGNDVLGCISSDGLEMYMDWYPMDGKSDLYVAKRASVDDAWGEPESLGSSVNTSDYSEAGASVSADGLTLYFTTNRMGGFGSGDLWMTSRATREAAWGSPVNMGQMVNSAAFDGYPAISADGLELYYVSYRAGGYGNGDIYVTTCATEDAAWTEAINLGPIVNTMYYENTPCLSTDGLRLFFSEHRLAPFRPGGFGGGDLWMSVRTTIDADWSSPVNLGPTINGPQTDVAPRLSHDASILYFSSLDRPDSPGLWDVWQAGIIPVVDFNGDGKVDGKEVLAIVDYWDEYESLYDIGPFPMGDGIVDANDLIVLADYIGTNWVDPTLRAHWTLDDGTGSVAMDWVGGHDAMIAGNVAWQPEGKAGGALAFDGKQNFVRTISPVLDPTMGPFSAIAWIKGGTPGRVIISQYGGADWLYLDQFGMLTTHLEAAGANGKPLTSDAYLVDDQWHCVALVWDGTNRLLYVDSVGVARDTQPGLAASIGSLQMGCGKTAASTTLWSGLIDDVRIYNRVVRP